MPQVSLDTSANPPVRITPQLEEAGNSVITWIPAPTSPQTFVFVDVRELPPLIFNNKQVTDSEISIHDNGQTGYYPYFVVVAAGGHEYSSRPSGPVITEQGTGPVIHNV